MSDVRYRDVLRALLLGEHAKADALKSQLGDSAYAEADELISAVFCVAVEHRFAHDSSAAAVRSFMDEVQENFANATPPVKPLAAEALVRGVLGEDQLLDEVDPDDYTPTQLPLTRKIVAESADLQSRIDDLISDGEKIAAHWAAQDD